MSSIDRSGGAVDARELWSPVFRASLLRRARSLERDFERAEDLVQETMLRALRTPGLEPGEMARRWCFVVLRNTFLSRKRKEAVEGRASTRLRVELDASTDPVAPEGAALQGALDSLPREFREVLALVELAGCSYVEAAKHLDVPLGTVMSRLHRAKLRLRQALVDPIASSEGPCDAGR